MVYLIKISHFIYLFKISTVYYFLVCTILGEINSLATPTEVFQEPCYTCPGMSQ